MVMRQNRRSWSSGTKESLRMPSMGATECLLSALSKLIDTRVKVGYMDTYVEPLIGRSR
jgi:hypothetical protein